MLIEVTCDHFQELRAKDLLLLDETEDTSGGPLLIPMAADADDEESGVDEGSNKDSDDESEVRLALIP